LAPSTAEPDIVLLCVDVGNSQTAVGLFEGERLVRTWHVATEERRTADEWVVLLRGLLREVPDAVGADLARVVHVHRDAAAHAGLDHQVWDGGKRALQHLADLVQHHRDR